MRAQPGGLPRFEVLFLLQPQGAEVAAPDAEIAAFPIVGTQAQDFLLVLDLVESGGGLVGTFSHNQALLDSTTALRWRGHLEALLAGVAADPTRPLTELLLLSASERHQVTFEWGRPCSSTETRRRSGSGANWRASRPARPPFRRRHPGGERAGTRRSRRVRRGEGRARLRGPRADRALRAGQEPQFPLSCQTEAPREAYPRR